MVEIQYIAAFLLVERAIAVAFMLAVLIRQVKLFGKPINFDLVPNISKLQERNVYRIRRVLFALSLVIFLGNMIPIAIDSVTLFIETSRPSRLSELSILYALSNAFTDMLSGIMIWLLYRLAGLGTTNNDK